MTAADKLLSDLRAAAAAAEREYRETAAAVEAGDRRRADAALRWSHAEHCVTVAINMRIAMLEDQR